MCYQYAMYSTPYVHRIWSDDQCKMAVPLYICFWRHCHVFSSNATKLPVIQIPSISNSSIHLTLKASDLNNCYPINPWHVHQWPCVAICSHFNMLFIITWQYVFEGLKEVWHGSYNASASLHHWLLASSWQVNFQSAIDFWHPKVYDNIITFMHAIAVCILNW
jgi:hypothetical protein